MEIERQAGEIRKDLLKGEGDDGDKSEERWLQGLEGEWKGFLNQMLLIRSIFLHLDRTFVLQSAGLLSIW
jgi:cullin-4